ncbi:CPBP family intramembrane glutamic endopeptidase [uncultured Polaribacter sp.]|uniref:CPBP family intramembrane glutamic endopeptidase n=1 Tax=uncultured Polaribacter sp. TaxID=174711 RepID=UPI002624F503|nr:CPBP family intramembrane glutamic endopeptidase [uncultured Polaribacter sp.]
MKEQLILTLIILISTLPIILIFRENKANFTKNIGLLTLYHIVYVILIFLPLTFTYLSISDSKMNWTGKLLAIIFSITIYFITRKYFKKHDFILSLPRKGSRKRILIVGLITVLTMSLLTIAFSGRKDLNLDVLFYQIIMPGLDEELWRGILLGFLILILKDKKYKLGHPAVWVITLIFALGHSLYLQNGDFSFALDAFIITGILGYILGWMIYYSRSILPAIIFHNLINFSTNALEMFVL